MIYPLNRFQQNTYQPQQKIPAEQVRPASSVVQLTGRAVESPLKAGKNEAIQPKECKT